MNNRYLYRAKRIDNGEWITWNILTGIPHNAGVLVDTVCACTGLKDKNGKLIWENDIVKINGVVYICFWNESNFEWGFKNNAEDFGVAYVSSDEINVIGSVIDNPELLEVGE